MPNLCLDIPLKCSTEVSAKLPLNEPYIILGALIKVYITDTAEFAELLFLLLLLLGLLLLLQQLFLLLKVCVI